MRLIVLFLCFLLAVAPPPPAGKPAKPPRNKEGLPPVKPDKPPRRAKPAEPPLPRPRAQAEAPLPLSQAGGRPRAQAEAPPPLLREGRARAHAVADAVNVPVEGRPRAQEAPPLPVGIAPESFNIEEATRDIVAMYRFMRDAKLVVEQGKLRSLAAKMAFDAVSIAMTVSSWVAGIPGVIGAASSPISLGAGVIVPIPTGLTASLGVTELVKTGVQVTVSAAIFGGNKEIRSGDRALNRKVAGSDSLKLYKLKTTTWGALRSYGFAMFGGAGDSKSVRAQKTLKTLGGFVGVTQTARLLLNGGKGIRTVIDRIFDDPTGSEAAWFDKKLGLCALFLAVSVQAEEAMAYVMRFEALHPQVMKHIANRKNPLKHSPKTVIDVLRKLRLRIVELQIAVGSWMQGKQSKGLLPAVTPPRVEQEAVPPLPVVAIPNKAKPAPPGKSV